MFAEDDLNIAMNSIEMIEKGFQHGSFGARQRKTLADMEYQAKLMKKKMDSLQKRKEKIQETLKDLQSHEDYYWKPEEEVQREDLEQSIQALAKLKITLNQAGRM